MQTAVVYISYVNELRLAGTPLAEAIREGAILRLRPIMMTALVAALGLLPAALATGVGTDSQRPFALVIVSGLARPPADQRLPDAVALRAGGPAGRPAGGVTRTGHPPLTPAGEGISQFDPARRLIRRKGRTDYRIPRILGWRKPCHSYEDSFRVGV